MTKSGHNEGFRVLDDFVFESVSDSKMQNPESPCCQAHNEGLRIVEDIVIDFQRCHNEGLRIVEDIVVDLKAK